MNEVETHFHTTYKNFDSYYDEKKNVVSKLIDRTLRRSMAMRFDKVIASIAPYEGKTVLDVGCGTGRYCFALLDKGIRYAEGIDFAENMIREANALARQHHLENNCRFMRADFLQMTIDEPFDHVFAMGVLDYIDQPIPFVRKMAQSAKQSVMVSFPSKGGMIQTMRKFIFRNIKKCPVYFYTEDDVRHIAEHSGARNFVIHKLSKDYFLDLLF
ncbi:MAG: class I SAM-dependent methyltransferase [Candidatus Omnitrophota bacterium]